MLGQDKQALGTDQQTAAVQPTTAVSISLEGDKWRSARELSPSILDKYKDGECICNIFYPNEGGLEKEGILGNIRMSSGPRYQEIKVTFEGWMTKSALESTRRTLSEDFRSRAYDFKETINLDAPPAAKITTVAPSVWDYQQQGVTIDIQRAEKTIVRHPATTGWHFQEITIEKDGGIHSALFLRHPAGRDCPDGNTPILLISPRAERPTGEVNVDTQQSPSEQALGELAAPALAGSCVSRLEVLDTGTSQSVEPVILVAIPQPVATERAPTPSQEEINEVVRQLNKAITDRPNSSPWCFEIGAPPKASGPVAEEVVKLFKQHGYSAEIKNLSELGVQYAIEVRPPTGDPAS
jgi:hypothetical protein